MFTPIVFMSPITPILTKSITGLTPKEKIMEYQNELVDAVGNSLSIGDEIAWMPGTVKGTIESFTSSGKSARWTEPYELKRKDGTTITRTRKYCKPLHKLIKLPRKSVGNLEEKDLLIGALTQELEETQLKLLELTGTPAVPAQTATSDELAEQLVKLLTEE